jgi:hypothetical protein
VRSTLFPPAIPSGDKGDQWLVNKLTLVGILGGDNHLGAFFPNLFQNLVYPGIKQISRYMNPAVSGTAGCG